MQALPSLRQLRYLVALAERLNFTRAAEDCFVTQSTLSAGIKELEDTLGVRLVERDRQNVLLTAAGNEVLARARALLAQAQDLAQFAAAAGKPMQGLLRLGVIPTIAPFLLPPLMTLTRHRYPGLKLALREDLTANLLAQVGSGNLDFALIALPYETGDLDVRALFRDELWLAGPRDDPMLKAHDVRIGASAARRLLLLEEGHCLREHSLAACRRAPDVREGLEATSLLTLVQMVESGLGLALIPEMAIKSGLLKASPLIARPLAEPHPARMIALAARASSARKHEFDALGELLLEQHRASGPNAARGARRRSREGS
jgi:LysR family hydrogen peroxide-inducible transcriptional activator